jgi:hypothetical protein
MIKSSQQRGTLPFGPNDQVIETKKYHNYSLAFYQKDAALN